MTINGVATTVPQGLWPSSDHQRHRCRSDSSVWSIRRVAAPRETFAGPISVPGVSPYLNNDRNLINPAAFSIPLPGTFGDLPRNALRGPNFSQFDLVLNKRFPLTESTNLEFRTEIFNIFNFANFAVPSSTLNNALPTISTAGVAVTRQSAARSGFTQAQAGGHVWVVATDRRAHRRSGNEPSDSVCVATQFLN